MMGRYVFDKELFVRFLKERRKSLGFSMDDVGELLGVSCSTISLWERGTQPKVQRLLDVCTLFDVNPMFFIKRED